MPRKAKDVPPCGPQDLEALCLECGLCCDGALFRDVELQPGDDAAFLKSAGLPLKTSRGKTRLPQPCRAFDGSRCRIYADRPARCRQFDCAIIQGLRLGNFPMETGAFLVRKTLRLLKRLEKQLCALGETDSAAPLQLRFQRVTRRLEAGGADSELVQLYGRLTIAWQQFSIRVHTLFLSTDADP